MQLPMIIGSCLHKKGPFPKLIISYDRRAIGVALACYHIDVVMKRLEAEDRAPTSTPCEPSSHNGARAGGPASTDRAAPTSTEQRN